MAADDAKVVTVRRDSDEAYVIDLCDELLGERASRQHRFPWLVGDAGRDGRCRHLPVDAYYARRKLVVEYRERQHDEPVAFFDRRETISGVGRGEQRRLYDLRREDEIPRHGLELVIVRPCDLACDARKRLRRTPAEDRPALRRLFALRMSDGLGSLDLSRQNAGYVRVEITNANEG